MVVALNHSGRKKRHGKGYNFEFVHTIFIAGERGSLAATEIQQKAQRNSTST